MIFGKDPSPFPLSHAKAVFADQVRLGPARWAVLFAGMRLHDLATAGLLDAALDGSSIDL
jgi:hypothetical protein